MCAGRRSFYEDSSQKQGARQLRQVAEAVQHRVGGGGGAEAIGGIDEGDAGLTRGLLVSLGVAQVEGAGMAGAFQHQADVIALEQTGVARAGAADKAVPGAGQI